MVKAKLRNSFSPLKQNVGESSHKEK